jgi:NADH-quinone oxidoreductase subunit H
MPELLAVPGLLAVLLAGAAAAAALDRVLVATGEGRPVRAAAVEPFAQTARLLVQRRRTTVAPDALLWRLSGGSLLVVAALMLAVVPLGARPLLTSSVGVVWFNAMDVLLWASFWLLGWGANSAYALVGGYRFLAQALAYELPLMFAITAPAVRAGSLDLERVVASQDGLWNVVLMPVAFGVLLVAVLGFSALGPFAHPLGPDLGGGVLAELSGVDRLVVLAGRYALLVAGAAFSVPLFLGGGSGPVLPAAVWTLLKTAAVVAVLLAVRHRLPVLRGDRLLELGFVVLLPLTVLQLLVPSLLVVGAGR